MSKNSFSEYMESIGANRQEVNRLKAEMRTAIEEYRLKEIRRTYEITQAQLAHTIGVSQNRISDIENGNTSSLKLGTLVRYADALGCDLEVYVCPRKALKSVSDVPVKLSIG